jgi:hypothetical protein
MYKTTTAPTTCVTATVTSTMASVEIGDVVAMMMMLNCGVL